MRTTKKIKLRCGQCGAAFLRSAKTIKRKRDIGQKVFFCDSKCARKNFYSGRSTRSKKQIWE